MVLFQRPLWHGRSPHIGRGQPLQDGKLAAPLVNVDTAAVVELPVDAVAALAAGQLTGLRAEGPEGAGMLAATRHRHRPTEA